MRADAGRQCAMPAECDAFRLRAPAAKPILHDIRTRRRTRLRAEARKIGVPNEFGCAVRLHLRNQRVDRFLGDPNFAFYPYTPSRSKHRVSTKNKMA